MLAEAGFGEIICVDCQSDGSPAFQGVNTPAGDSASLVGRARDVFDAAEDAVRFYMGGDGVGDACDSCPLDGANDTDHDGLCADEDPCELDALNDLDSDGLCGDRDADDDGDALFDFAETNTGVFVDANDAGTDPLNPDTNFQI